MKIDINRIPLEGLRLTEEIAPNQLDLETESIKFKGVLKLTADIVKITNTVSVYLNLDASAYTHCSRCLDELEINFKKELNLNYPANKLEPVIDLGPDIRDELILDYPLKPLCRSDCKGLCSKCGKNLNQGGCSCAITEKKTF